MMKISYRKKNKKLKKDLLKKVYYLAVSYSLECDDNFDFFYEITGLNVPREELEGKTLYTSPDIFLKLYEMPHDPWNGDLDVKTLIVVSEPSRTITELK